MAIAYLANKFEAGREYHEREVNEVLVEWHTFGDWALLRRLLFDWRHMDRESDGTRDRLRLPTDVVPSSSFATGLSLPTPR